MSEFLLLPFRVLVDVSGGFKVLVYLVSCTKTLDGFAFCTTRYVSRLFASDLYLSYMLDVPLPMHTYVCVCLSSSENWGREVRRTRSEPKTVISFWVSVQRLYKWTTSSSALFTVIYSVPHWRVTISRRKIITGGWYSGGRGGEGRGELQVMTHYPQIFPHKSMQNFHGLVSNIDYMITQANTREGN